MYRGKEFRQSNESSAEDKLLKMLSAARTNGALKTGFLSQETIVLKWSVPDFYFPEKKLCVYLDGPPHLKAKKEKRDDELNEFLAEKGYKVMRFPYKPPLSDREAKAILEEIIKEVNGRPKEEGEH